MKNDRRFIFRAPMACLAMSLAVFVILTCPGAFRTVTAQNPAAEKVLYNFAPATGSYPTGVIRDTAGNLYVATTQGGTGLRCTDGCGSILELTPSGQLNVVYTFTYVTYANEGPHPNGLVRDAAGNLFSATMYGGSTRTEGSVIKITPSGTAGLLHSFEGGNDGSNPESGLTINSQGTLYGTTPTGGGTGCAPHLGCGVIYEVTRTGIETVLYSFTGGEDGALPAASPILDSAGNLYGTAVEGGDLNCSFNPGLGCGTVWKLDTSGNFSVLYSFTGGADGAFPAASLVPDSFGNLYGSTVYGGDPSCSCGVIFQLDTSGKLTVLHTFLGGSSDGVSPEATLLRDTLGNLYGTTPVGGDQSCISGCGLVFKIDTSNNETILHYFAGGTKDGEDPIGQLVTDGKGNLYGTTFAGGLANTGVIFKVQTQ